MPNEASQFSQFAAQPPAVAPVDPAVGATPPAPDPNAAPAWADQLMQTVTGLKSEFDAFRTDLANAPGEEDLNPTPPAPVAPAQEWVPKTYADVDQRIAEKAREQAQAILDERDKQAQAAQTAAQQQERDIDTYLDGQVAQLEQAAALPKVANPADPSDPGRQARAELFGYAYSLGTTNLMAVADTLKTHHSQGLRYDVTQGKLVATTGSQAPGATAPIAGGTVPGGVPQNAVPNANFFRMNDLDAVAEYAKKAIQ